MKEAQEILERGVDEEKTSEDTESTKEYDATTIFTSIYNLFSYEMRINDKNTQYQNV